MGPVLVIVIATAVIGVAALLVLRRRSPTSPDTHTPGAATPRRPPADETPMTGLESALDQITDSAGRTMRDRLDAETDVVDDLRVPDDTGPLLRRALDEFADDTAANERPGPLPEAES